MDDREVRDALERAQSRLATAMAKVDELEQRKRVAELNEQQHRALVAALEERVRSLEAALSRATSLRAVRADDAQRQRLAEQLVSTRTNSAR